MPCNLKKWAAQAVAAIWPRFFRWSHLPIVTQRHSSHRPSLVLGRDMFLESRESPTTIWRLDPIVAAALSSGLMGQIITQMQTLYSERQSETRGTSRPEISGTRLDHTDHAFTAKETPSQVGKELWESSGNRQSPSAISQMGGVPSPTQTIPSDSENSFTPSNSHPFAWENDQLVAGLESSFNLGSIIEDPFGSSGEQGGSGTGGAGYADDDGLSLLGAGWTGADVGGSIGGSPSNSGAASDYSGPMFSGGLDNQPGPSIPPGAFNNTGTVNQKSGFSTPAITNRHLIPNNSGQPGVTQTPPPSSPPNHQTPPAPQVTWSSPVLKSVWRFGPSGHGRLLIQGSLDNTAPLGTQVTFDFYGKDPIAGTTWLLGSKNVTQTKAGSIDFMVDLDADPPLGTWVCAEVHGRPDASGSMPSVDTLTEEDWSRGMQLPGGANGHAIPHRNLLEHVTIPVGNGESITIDSPGHPLDDIQMFHPPGLDTALPMGLMGFTVTNLPVGGHAVVRITLPDGMNPTTYYRHDPNTGLLTPFMFDGKEGAEIHKNVVLLHLVDGGYGDADGQANGVIVDPQGPGTNSLPWPNVAVMPAATTGEMVTLGSADPITNLMVSDAPNSAIVMPLGLFTYDVTGMLPGGTAQVQMVVPSDVYVDGYFKQDPVSGRLLPFDCCGSGLAAIDGQTITLNLTDGGAGDEDGQADGVIVDPGGPSAGTIYIPCDTGLGQGSGWNTLQTGGSGGGVGTVTYASSTFTLNEGNSFQVALSHSFTVPTSPNILTFDYKNLTFGSGTPGRMNDAFEVSFVAGVPAGLTATLAAGGALTANQAYFYEVTATNAQGEFGPSNEATATPTAGNQTINLSWAAVIGATGYNVYRGTTSGGENVLIGQVVGTSFSDNGITGSTRSPVSALIGNSLVPTIAPGRNVFFNLSRGQTSAALATGVTLSGVTLTNNVPTSATVDLDISKLFAGTSGTLIFRLVNNDPDTNTSVQISCHLAPTVTESLLNDTGPAGGPSSYFHDLITNDPRITGTAVAATGATITKLEAAVDQNITYTDITSTLNVDQYTWNPGALAAGQHTIYVRATDSNNLQTVVSLTFTVNTPPVANAGGNQTIIEGSWTTFDGSSSTDTDADGIYNYLWTFPDGSTASGPNSTNSSFQFPQPGTYTVSLAVIDGAGSVVTNSDTITVLNQAPQVIAPAPQSVPQASTLSFQTTFTDPGPLDTHTATINWGDGITSMGTVVEEKGGIGSTPITPGTVSGSHVYAEEGLYQPTITVTDNGNLSGPATFAVTVTDAAPTVSISGASTATAGSPYPLTLTASGGADLVTGWTIKWGDGGTDSLGGLASADAHTYSSAGVYTITATATTDDGTLNANQIIVTVGSPTSVSISGPSTTNEGSVYTLNLISGGQSVTSWSITWGDGASTNNIPGSSTTTTHTYADGPNNYTIGGSYVLGGTSHTLTSFNVTVNNVGPTVSPAANQTVVKNTSLTVTCNFTDPGYTSAEGPFTGSINWGDGNTSTNPTITPNTSATPTTGTVSSSHTYTAAGNYTVTVTVTDDENASSSAQFVIYVLASGPVKFFTIDKSQHIVFEYDSSGNSAGSFGLSGNNQNGWGITTNAAMSKLWIVDANRNGQVYVYGTDGSLKGWWLADKNIASIQDIATDGADIWILDNSSGHPKIWRFASAASYTSDPSKGKGVTATSSFALDSANGFPTGMVTDGVTIWVTDKPNSGSPSVFVYDLTGRKLGNWTLDAANNNPTGITLNPNYITSGTTTDLWVVDRQAAKVYRYAGGSAWRSGSHSATSNFALSSSDSDAQGIADPVTVTVAAPPNNTSYPQGSPVLVSGMATPSSSTAVISDVTVNGQSAVVDSAGNYFLPVPAVLGNDPITVTAVDTTNATASASLSITGTAPVSATGLNPGAIDFSQLSDVTGSFNSISYGITSFNSGTSVLYADMTATDNGTYSVRGPFLVEVKHISAPSVRVRGNTGVAVDGTPYYDLTSLLPTAGIPWASIAPGQSLTSTLQFYDPEGLPFTYDLVFLGRLNHAPRWTSAPVITVANNNKLYTYAATAIDPDGDPLRFSVVSAPSGFGIADASTGVFTWPSSINVGAYPIRLRVSDNQGGSADQTYLLYVGPAFAPTFTSTPVVDAYVNQVPPYTYLATAVDPDGESLTFSIVSGPTGMTLNNPVFQGGQYAITVNWTPTAAQLGNQTVTLQVSDGGATATQTYTIVVHQQLLNHPPIFITTAPTTIPAGQLYQYPSKAIDPDGDVVTYSLVSGPTGLGIGAGTGMVAWQVGTGITGNYSVTIQASDGRGGVTTQSWTITVTSVNSQSGAIYGTKYSDGNNDGSRDANWLYPAPASLGPIALQQVPVATSDAPSGIAYDPALNAMLISTQPTNNQNSVIFKILKSDGTTGPFATVTGTGAGDGNVFAVAPAGNTAGFVPGDVYFPAGAGGNGPLIGKISNNGATINTAWGTTPPMDPHCGNPFIIVAFDTAGVFNGYLLAIDGMGDIYKFDATGHATYVAQLHAMTFTEGSLVTIPNNATLYGPLSNKLVVVQANKPAETVDSSGNDVVLDQTSYWASGDSKGLDNADAAAQVVSSTNFFAIGDLDPHVWVGLGAQFNPIIGQIVTSNPAAGTFNEVYYDSTNNVLHTKLLTMVGNVPLASDMDPIAFLPAAFGSVQAPTEPGLPNWTIYLDTNNNGVLDAGEPSTTTDANGNYSFINLAAATYHVREVPQTGWTQTAPTGGSYTVTLTSIAPGNVASGIDFGNHETSTDTAPSITTTAPAIATVGQIYGYPQIGYQAAATDSDGDPLTWDLPVAPAGMAVDPVKGIVVWVPTFDQVGTANVLLRVSDGRGGVNLQSFQITVSAYDTAPVITSTAPSPAVVGVAYLYPVKAQDAEHDTLTYTMGTVSPTPASGNSNPLTLNASTGVLTWTPLSGDATKTFTIPITVTDSKGNTASQTVSLLVNSTGTDHAPSFTSSARTTIALGQTYLYQVTATDPDNDVLTYTFTGTPPTGMVFSSTFAIPNQALIQWTPTSSQVGATNTFTVQVSDGRGMTASQTVTVSVTDQATNLKPVITSNPPLSATVGQMYAYNLTGSDPNGDPIYWSLVNGPWGMSVDPNLGTLRWLPTAIQVGSQAVTVKLVDAYGGSASQTWTITVRGTPAPPVITSTPPLQVYPAKPWFYAVQAYDPNGLPLTYTLTTYPTGMTINNSTGLITWPSPAGSPVNVTVQVSDGLASTSQSWTLSWNTKFAVNYPPAITSLPGLTDLVGTKYTYTATYSDRDGDSQSFAATASPTPAAGSPFPFTMTAGGVLTWQPVAADIPSGQTSQNFTITVTDTDGGTDITGDNAYTTTQVYTLTVRSSDSGPSITSSAPTSVTLGNPYRYDVIASDSDGDPLTYALSGSVPSGMTVDAASGRVTWTPTATGTYSGITVKAIDSFGVASPGQTFSITVSADTTPPTVELQISANPVPTGTKVTFLVFATDNVAVTSETLTVGGTNLQIDSKGQAFMTMTTIGNYSVIASAKDAAGNTGTAPTQTLAVSNPTGTPPTISLTAPSADANITAPTAVTGSVSDDHTNGVSYTVTVIPFDGSPSFQIGSGSVTGSSTLNLSNVTFDPTMLANGDYTIEVKATDTDDNITTTLDRHVTVSAKLKLGRETLSVTDLTIPVAGVPLTVVRTYDSLEAGKSFDFGYGWRLSFGDAKLKVDLAPGFDQGWGGYPAFTTGTRVYVTMPGGEREGFTFQPYQQAYDQYGIIVYWHPYFAPDTGVFDTLTVQDALLTQDPNTGVFSTITDGGNLASYNPADPQFGGSYTVTNLSGMGSVIDATSGKLISETARNGNSISFTPSSITSNTGKSVSITRDPQGRITAITDPRNNSVKYAYDANGNLVSVTDRLGDPPTQYTYDPNHAHYLNGIIDPLGVQQLSATFDTTGRMTQVQDALHNSLNFGYNTSSLQQTVTDPNLPSGQQTATVGFDNRGNPNSVQDPTGAQTTAQFTNDLPTSVTQVKRLPGGGTTNLTTTANFNSQGEPTSVTDPTGAITRTTYGQFGVVQTTSDALGDTVTNSYDTNGNLLSTVSAAGVYTAYGYDTHNNLTSVTTAAVSNPGRLGQTTSNTATTTYGYDNFGYLASSTSPTGVTTGYQYDQNGNALGTSMNWTDPSNILPPATVTTSTVYDALDRVSSSVDQFGKTSHTYYDSKGRVTSSVDTLNNTTSSIYDARDEVIQTLYPVDPNYPTQGTTSESVYDAEGRVIYATDPHVPGQADIRGTHTIYDSMGRVTQTERRDGMVITISSSNGVYSSSLTSAGAVLGTTSSVYNDLGQVTSNTDAAMQTTSYQYDNAGRQISVTDPLQETSSSTYDAAGRLIASTDANQHTTQYLLDPDGKTLRTTFFDGSITLSAYDSQGRQTAVTDQMGLKTQYQYDLFGRLTGVVLPMVVNPATGATVNPTTNYAYDIYGNMSQITDVLGRQTKFTFDQFGHQMTHTLPMSQQESSTYDSFGRMSSSLDFQGNKTVYAYDTLGRVATKTLYPYNNLNTAGETITYHFDSLGRNDTVTDVIGSNTRLTTYGFDVENRVTSVTTPEGTINYVYDQATGRHTETSTTNSDIQYGYDQLGRVNKVTVTKQNGVTLGTSLVINYYYTPVGLIDHITYPNGTETDYAYNTLNRLTSVTNKVTSSGNILSSYSYTLNADGLRTGVTEQQLESGGSLSTTTKTWTYDNLQRLTGEAVTSTNSGQSYTDTYSYDLVGNRLSKTDVVGSTTTVTSDTFNNNDQLTSETGTVNNVSSWSTTFGYDPNGSLTSVTRTGSGAETDTYGYDLQHRLSSATISRTEQGQSVAISASYTYDDSGYRAQGSVTVTVGNGSPTTTVTNYLTDTMNPTGYTQVLEEHTNGSASPSMSYIIGLSVVAQTNSSGATNYLMIDGQGSTRQMTDSSGNITARFAFDAYGNLLYVAVGVLNAPATKSFTPANSLTSSCFSTICGRGFSTQAMADLLKQIGSLEICPHR